MTNTRSTARDHLRVALSLTSVGLVSLLCWQAAPTVLGQGDHCIALALAPLMFASFRHPLLGRLLAWSGVLAQIAIMIFSL